MDSYQQEIGQIQEILNENPKGMTVTDISRKIKINRNSVAKYLDIMKISGLVEMITFGPAKVYFPSKRIPITNLINFTSDFIIVLDSKLKINLINDTFLLFIKTKRKEIIHENFSEYLLPMFEDYEEIKKNIEKALDGKSFIKQTIIENKNNKYETTIKIIPITFEDGRHGVSLIINTKNENK